MIREKKPSPSQNVMKSGLISPTYFEVRIEKLLRRLLHVSGGCLELEGFGGGGSLEGPPDPEDALLVVVDHVSFAAVSPAPTGGVLLHKEPARPPAPLPGQIHPPWDRLDQQVAGKGRLRPALFSMKINLEKEVSLVTLYYVLVLKHTYVSQLWYF